MSWWDGRMVAFDLETTSALPEQARIVSAALAEVGGEQGTDARAWLCDPGVEIPEEATAVHGISTQRAREEGVPVAVVVELLFEAIRSVALDKQPLVIFNARYDLTVLDRECRRHLGHGLGATGMWLRVVDPMVIDRWLWRYRSGSRKLEAMCETYRVKLEGAHDATFDAVAAARLAWVMGSRGQVVRRVRSWEEEVELAELRDEWDRVRGDLGLLHEAQARWSAEERVRFAEYKAGVGELEVAARVRAERGWPVLDVMDHEEAMG